MRGVLIILLAILGVLGALVAFDVIPLGTWLGDEAARDGGALAMLDDDGGDEAAELQGTGRGASASDTEDEDDLAFPEPEVRAEAAGTTEGGLRIIGRIVLAETKAPVPGVDVRLVRDDPIAHYLGAPVQGRWDTLAVRTGPDGRFVFRDVTPSDKYVVRARPTQGAAISTGLLDLRGTRRKDLGDLLLGPSASWSGVVVGADGTPASDVRVAVSWPVMNPLGVVLADPDAIQEIEAEQRTDAQGRFHFEHLAPGAKTVIAKAPTGAAGIVRRLDLEEGATRTDGRIELAGAGTISGFIQWEDGTPLPRARVFAGERFQAALRTCVSGPDGAFRLEAMPEGIHAVGVLVIGLPIQYQEQVALGTEGLVLRFPKSSGVHGRVVAGATRKPITRFRVLALPTGIQQPQVRFASLMVANTLGFTPFKDEEGRFRLPQLAAGTYTLKVEADGYPPVMQQVTVLPDGKTEELEIKLPKGNSATGLVLDARTREPLPDALVYVLQNSVPFVRGQYESIRSHVEDMIPSAHTDATGRFQLPAVTPGKRHLVVLHEDGLPAVLGDVDLRRGDVEDLEVLVEPAARIDVQVVSPSGPVGAGELVRVILPDGTTIGESTDETGKATIRGIPIGRCLIQVNSASLASRVAAMANTADQDERAALYEAIERAGAKSRILRGSGVVEVTLPQPTRVRVTGTVRVAGGPAEPGRWIIIASTDHQWSRNARVDEQGGYQVDLEPGTYQIWFPTAQGQWLQSDVEVPDARDFRYDIERD
jgi:hypothetical protein